MMSLGLARAQSSVTLYGIVDAGLQYASQTPNTKGQNAGATYAFTTSGNGPSLFGLIGKEDLGGGYRATFNLESGISLANGGFASSNGNLWGRQAWVGLEGNFGKFRLGEQNSPFFLTLIDSDPRHFSTFGSGIVIYGDNAGFTGSVNSNAITYSSPKLWGFEGSAMFAPGGVAGNFQAGKQWSGSLKYDNGTLLVNAAIYDGNAGGTVTPIPTSTAFLGRTLGMAYRLGTVTAKLSFVSYKVAGGFNNNIYGGGLDWYVLPTVDINGGVWVTSDRSDTTNHSVMGAVGVNYLLSKRTSLYAQFGAVNNHGAMNTGLSLTTHSILNEVPGTTYGANVGIRQTF
ncbi:porin [Paraburkholderia sp. RP-4-7]|uniref:Porin n=2 Tax=Paraburkholderia polaris TaxID=2728848 RepID=A0A848IP08_9BURK|nr:porin [Paraburkholderia polaris]